MKELDTYPKEYDFVYNDLNQVLTEAVDFDLYLGTWLQENPQYEVDTWIEIHPLNHYKIQLFTLKIVLWKI